MLKKILLGLFAVLVMFLVVVALQPSEYQVSRSATMAAPPAAVFAQVNDFHNWDAWSPWAKIDPGSKVTFEGPTAGKGAIFRWAGNDEIGKGSMTIVESQPNDQIRIKIDFLEPMAGSADISFTFKPEGEATAVTWSMSGTNNLIGKAFCLFMSMDKMIGGMYEKGLASLKQIVETTKQ